MRLTIQTSVIDHSALSEESPGCIVALRDIYRQLDPHHTLRMVRLVAHVTSYGSIPRPSLAPPIAELATLGPGLYMVARLIDGKENNQ